MKGGYRMCNVGKSYELLQELVDFYRAEESRIGLGKMFKGAILTYRGAEAAVSKLGSTAFSGGLSNYTLLLLLVC